MEGVYKSYCIHCDGEYDSDNEGNYDDATGLEFCCYECEANYDQTIGLPSKYNRSPH